MLDRRLLLLFVFPLSSHAQAWLSPKGDGTVSVLYQNNIERLHTFSDGRTKDRGHTYFDGLIVNTDLSLTDRLAVTVSLPFIAGKYDLTFAGSFPLNTSGVKSTSTASP